MIDDMDLIMKVKSSLVILEKINKQYNIDFYVLVRM